MNQIASWDMADTWQRSYEQVFVPGVTEALARRLVDMAQAPPNAHILDVACGTGVVTYRFAEQVGIAGQFVGFDLDEGMLEVARAKHPEIAIEWRQGDVLNLPFQDERFDIVTCQLGLMSFEDRVGGLQEMYRVLMPGGKLLVLVWGPIEHNPCFLVAANEFDRFAGVDYGDGIRNGMFVLGDLTKLRALAEEAGFPNVTFRSVAGEAMFPSTRAIVHLFGGLMQLQIDEATQADLLAGVTASLQEFIDSTGMLRSPIEVNLMQVRKPVATR